MSKFVFFKVYTGQLCQPSQIFNTKVIVSIITTLSSQINGWVLINRGVGNSIKYDRLGLFVYFDPNDVSVSRFAYVQTEL